VENTHKKLLEKLSLFLIGIPYWDYLHLPFSPFVFFPSIQPTSIQIIAIAIIWIEEILEKNFLVNKNKIVGKNFRKKREIKNKNQTKQKSLL
jgi:hypothetical protein